MIISTVQQIINEIYHSVGVAGSARSRTTQRYRQLSGAGKLYDFQRVNSLLINKSSRLQRAEEMLMTLVTAWMGEKMPGRRIGHVPGEFRHPWTG